MNVKLLRQVKRAILAHPTQVRMDTLFSHFSPVHSKVGGCGTAGCIAGWATFLVDKKKSKNPKAYTLDKASRRSSDNIAKARRALCLADFGQLQSLFYLEGWPDQFANALGKAKTAKQYAQVVADRIDDFIEENQPKSK